MISRDQLDIRQYAAQRMLERGISVADVLVMPIDTRIGEATAGARGVGDGDWHGPDCDHHGL